MRRIWIVLTAVLLGAGLGVPGAAAQTLTEAYTRVATWQSASDTVGAGLFRSPAGIAVGADGTIYVADTRLHAVHVLNGDGTPRALWDGKAAPGGAVDLGPSRDVAVGPDALFVSDPDGMKVHVFGLDGRYRTAWTLVESPAGLAWADGELYVTTTQTYSVLVMQANGGAGDGQVVRRWSTDVSQGQPSAPVGIDVGTGNDTRVYVADLAVKRVWIFDRQGILEGGLYPEVDNEDQPPSDVAVDSSGNVYVATDLAVLRMRNGALIDSYKKPGARGVAIGPGTGLSVTVQDSRLGLIGLRLYADRLSMSPPATEIGSPFAPLGTFERPRRLSANADGRVFVLDGWPRLQGWLADGTPQAQFASGVLHDVAAGLRASAYGIDGTELRYWTDDGTLLWNWRPPSTTPVAGQNPYGWLTAIDGLGSDLAVLDAGDQHVYVLDFSANPIAEWPIVPGNGFESVTDLALGTDKVFLVNRSQGGVEVRKKTDGSILGRFDVPGRATRIDADKDGNVYILTDAGWVWKRKADGTAVALWQVDNAHQAGDLTVGTAGRVYVAMGDTNEVRVYAPDPGGIPPEVPDFNARCTLKQTKTASPTTLELGARVNLELRVTGECPLANGRSDIILLVDTSGSMGGAKMSAARAAALEFVGQLDYSLNKIGLITFSNEATLVQELTDNPRELIRKIPNLGDEGATNMTAAFEAAGAEFETPRSRPEARKVVILLTDGRPSGDGGNLLDLRDAYRAQNRAIYAVGLGLDVDRNFLRALVTDPENYFDSPTEYDLTRIFEAMARRVGASVLLSQVTIEDELPTNMRYLVSSSNPPALYNPTTRVLAWQMDAVPPEGLTLRYQVRPLEAGDWPTNVRAVADFEDGVGYKGQLIFPVPRVLVTQPEVSRFSAYLPVLYRQQCRPVFSDVVLAFDTSTSMQEPTTPGGPTKMDSAVQAGRLFLSQLRLPDDRAALVAFNGNATLVQALSGNQADLAQAMGRLPKGTGTRIDLGLEVATQALAGIPAGRKPVIVLLTDGRQTGAPAEAALAAGQAARDAGISVFTIALGADADAPLLAQVAGAPHRAFTAATEANLAAIYREIAGLIPCD